MINQIVGLGLALAATSSAIATQCPVSGLCFSLGIPNITALSGSSDIYIQITGQASNGWLAVAQGTQMSNANYFFVYPDNSGKNITLSARSVDPNHMPIHNSSIQASLLPSSSISSSGVITANIKCSNCDRWNGGSMDFTSSSTNWIWAYGPGVAIKSDSVNTTISKHGIDAFGNIQFGVSAQGGKNIDPFGADTLDGAVSQCNGTPGSTESNVCNSTATRSPPIGSGPASISGEQRAGPATAAVLHGILAGLAFVFVFPLGGVLIRLMSFENLWLVHGMLQMVGSLAVISATGIGVYLAYDMQMMKNKHSVIGLIIVAAICLLPLFGWIHHIVFVRRGTRTISSYLHIWVGRIIIPLGMLNAVFGLQLGGQDISTIVLFSMTGAITWLIYIVSAVFGEKNRTKTMREKRMEKFIRPPPTRSSSEYSTDEPAHPLTWPMVQCHAQYPMHYQTKFLECSPQNYFVNHPALYSPAYCLEYERAHVS